jgi:uncharacterized protein YecE (DUF72 family)
MKGARMAGQIFAGVGGWTFEPWRGVFYPKGLPHKRELEFAAKALTAIEINGTYYSSFPPATWARWRAETPDGFVFAVKASRFATNRKVLPDAAPSIKKFLDQGLAELGDKLGPINWQLAPTKRFDRDEVAAFLDLLPCTLEGLTLRHAIEARHESFDCPDFVRLAKERGIAIVHADSETYPRISARTAPFTYARIMRTQERLKQGIPNAALGALANEARTWARRGDAFVFFISAAKVRNPAAAQAFLRRVQDEVSRPKPRPR